MYHKECEGKVMIDVTAGYRMLADVTPSNKSGQLSTVEIHVFNITEECMNTVYWCLHCNREVSIEELGFTCRGCSEPVHFEEGRLPLDTGGIYCPSCYESRCDNEDCQSLADVFTYESIVKLT